MRINRDPFNEKFTNNNAPHWNCSSCENGKIIFDRKDVTIYETKESKKDRDNRDWEPYWLDQYFTGKMQCNNISCKEIYIISGKIIVHEAYEEEYKGDYQECFYPNYIFPIIYLFDLPKELPIEVKKLTIDAFKLFWVDKSACANAIRTTVESILNDKKIPKTVLTKKKKRINLSLHERIEKFEIKKPEIVKSLMAVKWIGNAGSHIGGIYNKDLLDGFDILKYSFEKLYTSHDKAITKIIKTINKRRKPLI